MKTTAARLIIYSHGFGVRKDDRGLFIDIATAMPEATHIMFDYNQVDESTGNLTVAPLNKQAERLGQVIAETRANNPTAVIDLICHSQGCVVASLLKPQGIRKIIFTGPPAELSVEDMVRLFANRPGSEVNLNGVSQLKRADFSITNVPQEYWKSIENIDPIARYNELARVTSLTVINAIEDEIIGSKDFSGLAANVAVVEIKTGHNFEGAGRRQLIDAIKKETSNG
jgi:hypothetical protein